MTAVRWILLIGLAVVLWSIARALLPFDQRYGRYVFQTQHCPAPIARLTRPRFPDGSTEGTCWQPSLQRVEQAGIVLTLAVGGTCAGLLIVHRTAK